MIFEKECDLAHLPELVEEIKGHLGTSGILLLRGNLASGKTAFVKAFALLLGIKEAISSPTFSVLNEYDEGLFHYDIYQNGNDGFLKNGLLEKLDVEGFHLIEWAGKEFEDLLRHFGIPYSTIDIEPTAHETRIYKVNINAYA